MYMKDAEFEKEMVLRGWVLLGIGSVMINLVDKRAEAQKVLGESLNIGVELEDTVSIGLCHLRLGELFMFEDNLDKANKQFELAKAEFEVSGLTRIGDAELANPYLITNLYLDLAELNFKLHKNQEAHAFAIEAQKLAIENGYILQKVEAILKMPLITIAGSSGNTEEIFKYYDSAIKETANASTLLLHKVLNKILSQLRRLGKNEPDKAKIYSTKLLDKWKVYLSAKSREKKEYQFLNEWAETIEKEIIRWETLHMSLRIDDAPSISVENQ
jgi:hypothetical protein